MAHDLLVWCVLAFACLPLVYYLFTLETALELPRSAVPTGFAPPISVLKPIRGLDRHSLEHFATFCHQDYPEYEILFAVSDENDPAIPVIRRLADAYPERSIRLIVGVPALGPSSKVSKLCRLVREARHDVLVVSDSDIAVPPGYLRAVVAPFSDPGVGAVTCLYHGVSEGGFWSDLEAIGISTEFAPGVIVARRLEGVKFTLGATMATTRARLREIGGFEALLEYCADDFELGRRIASRGHRIELAACTVSTECGPAGFGEFVKHELRWAITLRHSRPWGYAGRMVITQGLPWSLAAAAIAPSQGLAEAYVLAYLVLRLGVAWAIGVRVLGDDTVRRRWWLIPFRDAISFAVSIGSLFSNRIDWRGRSFELQRGRLVPVAAAGGRPRRDAARRSSLLILLAIAAAIYIGSAPRPALLDDADGCHALAAHEILQRHDWSVLYINGIRWLEKPPLHYWLVAASYAVLGESAFSTRLPIALAMVALVLLVYEFGRHFFGERAGFYAGLVMGTSAGAYLFTRIMIPEALYALEFTAAFYLFLRAWTGTISARAGWWGYAAIVGLATLTRAGIGTLFPVGIVAVFLLCAGAWHRRSDTWRRLTAAPLWSSAAIALIVALPWHVMAGLRVRGFLWFYFVNEQVLRAVGRRHPADYTAIPLWLWWAAHLVWFFPWSLYLPYAWREIPPPRLWSRITDDQGQARIFVVVWAAVVFLFFSIVTGSRMEYYGFGAWPAVAILLGSGLARAEEQRDRWLPRLQGGLVVIGTTAAAFLLLLLWASRRVSSASDISSLLGRHDTSFYRVSMATLLDLTPQVFGALRGPAAIAAAALAAGPFVAWWLRRREQAWASTVTVALTMMVFCYAANLAFQAFEPRLSSRPLAEEVRGRLAVQDRIVVYGEFEQACSFSFYTGRPALIYRGRYNGLEFGSYFPDAPKIFLDDDQFISLWRSPGPVFLFVPPEQRESAVSRLPPNAFYLVSEIGGKALYANRGVDPVDRHERAVSAAHP